MAGIPKHGRRDTSESEVVKTLREFGADIEYLSLEDVPDLLVGLGGENYLVEVKTRTGKLSDGQQTWHENWHGRSPVVLRSRDEVIAWVIGVRESAR